MRHLLRILQTYDLPQPISPWMNFQIFLELPGFTLDQLESAIKVIVRYAFAPILGKKGRPKNKMVTFLKSRHQEFSIKSYCIKIGQTVQKLDPILCFIAFS